MTSTPFPETLAIAKLNDLLRTSFFGGKVLITQGVRALGPEFESACVEAVQSFGDFSPANDPYGEHDFGIVQIEGRSVYWKIDYYDRALEYGSENPADPKVTTRVLTIFLAEEY